VNANVNLSAAVGAAGLPGALATGGGVGMPLDSAGRSGESYAESRRR
jgi:hypothetical protein